MCYVSTLYIKSGKFPNTIFALKEDTRSTESDPHSFKKSRDFILTLLLLSTQKGAKNFCHTKQTSEFSNNFFLPGIKFDRMEIHPSVLYPHMLSELGNIGICKSAQELIPSSPPPTP